MNEPLHVIESTAPHMIAQEALDTNALRALEHGKVVYFPHYCVPHDPAVIMSLLNESMLAPKEKNMSYQIWCSHLNGFSKAASLEVRAATETLMDAFAHYAKNLVETIAPCYKGQLIWGRTSYRPAEIKGRKTSPRKNDTRLHVDAFSSTPVHGQRILRVFCNVNPMLLPREWLLGEQFEAVVERFLPQVPRYRPLRAFLRHKVGLTRSVRSAYDHDMLHMHDAMKLSLAYQKEVPHVRFDFPAYSTWMVFTDQVSHAALAGQYLLEQTFYLPVDAMQEPDCSPLKILECKRQQSVAIPSPQGKITMPTTIHSYATQLPGRALKGVKNTIAIGSGKGGVGKSTVAVNLALSLAKTGARVGLLDADIYGPSIPLMLGEAKKPVFDGTHYLPISMHGIHAMSIGYMTEGDPALIWRGPMLAKSLMQLLNATRWPDLDYLLIDLPPGTGDIQLTLVQQIPLAGAVVVTTPQTVATLDAQKAIQLFERMRVPVLGLVENMSFHVCTKCHHESMLFGQGGAAALSETFHVPLLGQLPLDARIGAACDTGYPVVLDKDNPATPIFQNAALKMLEVLAARPIDHHGKFPPIVVES